MTRYISITLCLLLVTGCQNFPSLPSSEGEKNSGFTYIPLDPLPVQILEGDKCYTEPDENGAYRLQSNLKQKELLESLPDNAVRVAIKEYDSGGKITYGPASIGLKDKRYQVVLDYINVDTTNLNFYIAIDYVKESGNPIISTVKRVDNFIVGNPNELDPEEIEKLRGNIVIPVYVGVGLRLTADLHVLDGGVSLSSLSSIATEVEAGRATGSLVVQTLGVTGKQVSTSLPLPSELNQTTVQNAILSLGAIKAIIYDEANTILTPRVTGMYLPIRNGDEELVNRIVSELARRPIPWDVACEKKST